MGMGGVQRVFKFAKYLPLFGWKPLVLTVKDVEYPAKDTSLLQELPSEVEIVRTGSFDPLRILFTWRHLFGKGKQKGDSVHQSMSSRSKLSSWFDLPDSKVGWFPFALFRALKLYRKEKFDLIFSSSPPPSLHLTGYLLKLITGTPWIADFRDPWIGYRLEIPPTPLHLFFKNKLKSFIIRKADKVIVANPVIKDELHGIYPEVNKVYLVDQGYDEEDFETDPGYASEIFTLGYFGTFSPDCDPEPVFIALGELIGGNKIPKEKIRFAHYGLSMGIDLNALIEKYQLKGVVQSRGYLSHRESLNEMKKVSLSLLVTSDDPLIFPAKVFEYLRLRKSILGIVPPESQIAGLLTKTNSGKVVSPADKDGIKNELLTYFTDFVRGKPGTVMNNIAFNRYERKSLTKKLASFFDQSLTKQKQSDR